MTKRDCQRVERRECGRVERREPTAATSFSCFSWLSWQRRVISWSLGAEACAEKAINGGCEHWPLKKLQFDILFFPVCLLLYSFLLLRFEDKS